MEDTWPRLRKNILELKMAVRNRRPIFEAYRDEDLEESPAATERMQLVSAALRKMQPDPTADEGGFDDMLFDILDAWFKGVSVLEIDWHVTQTHRLGRFIAPRCTRWANPIHYAWDTDLRLGLATDAVAGLTEPGRGRPTNPARRRTSGVNDPGYNSPLAPFPTDRFLVAKCKTKSGSILGGALLRPLVWWWCAANFSADWLLNLAQIFGLPFRWATYEPTAAQETVDRICAMLQNMGSAGWAAFPAGTSLELKADGQKSGAQTPQGDMLDRADKQCDLLVLGQTLTTDTGGMGSGGGSHALGQVHADVRSGIIDAAAKFTAGILEQQLIPAILRLNYGDCEEAPTLHLQPVTADNLQERAAILAQLHAAGAGSIIPLDWLGKTFGIPKPKDGEATLADTKQGAPVTPDNQHTTSYLDCSMQNATAARVSDIQGKAGDRLIAGNRWHDPLGRFTFGPSGSAGPNGQFAQNSANGTANTFVDRDANWRTPDGAYIYYEAWAAKRTALYKKNVQLLEENLVSTARGQSVTIAINPDGTPKKKSQVNPAALNLWKQIFLDDGTSKPNEPEKNLGECVSLVSNLTGVTPEIKKWHAGSRVIDSDDILPGTAIATFNDKGVYDSHDDPHAAVFIRKGTTADGKKYIDILEQFNPGHKARHPQVRRLFLEPEPEPSKRRDYSNVANYFHAIEVK